MAHVEVDKSPLDKSPRLTALCNLLFIPIFLKLRLIHRGISLQMYE